MKSLKTLSVALSVLFILPAYGKTKYPFVLQVQGKVSVTTGMTPRAGKAVKGLNLQTRAVVKAESESQIKIQWDEKRTLMVLENSEISVPAISFETGEAPLIVLKTGALRWQGFETDGYKVAVRSDLYEFILPPADFVLSINPVKAYGEVRVLKGRFEFSALNGENSVLVQSGQKAGFQGVLEEGQIAYDILLKGKKIPRGQLTPVRTLEKDDDDFAAKAEARQKKNEAAAKAAAAKKAEEKKQLNQICANPSAKFDQCAWVCEGNPKGEKKECRLEKPGVQCVRQRCNANGEWADKTVLEREKAQSLCKSASVTGPCDY